MLRIRQSTISFTLLVVMTSVAAFFVHGARGEDADFFEKKIRPILVENCYSCHSTEAKKLKGGLYLDSRQGVRNGGKDGPILVPGDPEHSRLIEAVRWTNADLKMPPKRRLSSEQVADLTAWVKLGAPDPRDAAKPVGGVDLSEARKQWPYHPPIAPAIPQVADQAWCRSPIDRFILAKLEENGLKPAPSADKRMLIRRAYFDLIGLPPTPEQVDAFVGDHSPAAFAKVVDELLANPHYGERWGRHWLDVVRYTDSYDSRGVGNPGDCANAFRYRDWVVKSFNDDLPYDRFIKEQVAGDLLPGEGGAFNADGLVATEMYVIGNWPGGEADRKKMLTDIVDDQIDVTGRAFLGLTLACARCHDHKFDPISTNDYYGMAGIFFSSHFMPGQGSSTSGGPLLRFTLAPASEVQKRTDHDAQIVTLENRVEQIRNSAVSQKLIPDVDKYLVASREYRLLPKSVARPTINAFAAERNLNGQLLTRWLAYLAPYFSHDISRTLLATPHASIKGIAGLDGWTGAVDEPPVMTANSTSRPITLGTIIFPARSVTVHPGVHSGVAVGWRNPGAASVSIRGRVIDADKVCGDGIDWAIDQVSAGKSRRIASGEIPNGGREEFSAGSGAAALDAVMVKPGDMIQVAVYPKGNYSCDTTVVELDVVENDGARRAWNLTREILGDVLAGGKGNPHADAFGNAGVWQFYEIPDEPAGGALSNESSLAKWADIANGPDAEQISAAAIAVRQSLIKLDSAAADLRKQKKDLAALPGSDAKLYRDLTAPKGLFAGIPIDSEDGLSAQARQEFAEDQRILAELKKQVLPPLPMCEGMTEGGVPNSIYAGISDTHIHIRGRYDRLGDLVARHLPRLLAGDNQPPITQGSGRIELANFLAAPSNPLTARVMVNRLWQHHFDDGIVRTPNNYGKLGRPPTHPELLDWLALEFVRSGWSIKTMQREIMLSAAYQQSSIPDPATFKSDPEDLLFGWVKRRRLEAEAIRDNLLVQSGALDPTIGGPSIRDLNTHRRTLYLMTIRSERSDYRTLFDAADSTAIVDQRIDSTVAPQALFLMNNPFVLEQAKGIAQRAVKEGPAGDREKIDWLYRHLYSRAATEKEIEVGLELLKESETAVDGKPALSADAAWEAYCQVLVCANEFVYMD